MANPPFNVDGIDKAKLDGDPRFPSVCPRPTTATTSGFSFLPALNETGRAGFVMANSAVDARHSEREIRRKLIESGSVDVMVAVGPNFFYTVTLPGTLWFLDQGKASTQRETTVLFIDARQIFARSTAPTATSRRNRSSSSRTSSGSTGARSRRLADGERRLLEERFPDGVYADVPGLCKVATIDGDRGARLEPQPGPLRRDRGRGARR